MPRRGPEVVESHRRVPLAVGGPVDCERHGRADVRLEREHLTEAAVYATALAMNYLTRGKFVQP